MYMSRVRGSNPRRVPRHTPTRHCYHFTDLCGQTHGIVLRGICLGSTGAIHRVTTLGWNLSFGDFSLMQGGCCQGATDLGLNLHPRCNRASLNILCIHLQLSEEYANTSARVRTVSGSAASISRCAEYSGPVVDACCIAICGPVDGEKAGFVRRTTIASWPVTSVVLESCDALT